MLNYWWVTRPKRKLDSVPEVLAAFAEISLDQEWSGQRNMHMSLEEALEEAGLKRVGERRDQGGSGGRTYAAWLESLGLIFKHGEAGKIKLTLAGEAIIDGASPVEILKNQIFKYQFPSAFSLSRGVQVSERFKIRPFRFLLKLLADGRIGYLSQSEIARVVAVNAENETDRCYEEVVEQLLRYRAYGDECLADDFFIRYRPGRGDVNPEHPYSHLEDLANTMVNWMEYTQLCKRDEEGMLRILEEKKSETARILEQKPPFIERPADHEFFQRKYGLDPGHQKDLRNLDVTQTITAKIIAENKIRQAYIKLSLTRPITTVTPDLVDELSYTTGITPVLVENVLCKAYPHGNIGAFMSSYFEMAFKGTEEAVDFEKATTELFQEVFHFKAKHLGQTGSKSAPDILVISDNERYQAIIDNKAYSKYSITGDHHNRMVHNYIEKINTYSQCKYPIGFFSYIAGGFCDQINRQIMDEVTESGIHGSGITVSNFIKMVENQSNGSKDYTHEHLRKLFGMDRQILLSDI